MGDWLVQVIGLPDNFRGDGLLSDLAEAGFVAQVTDGVRLQPGQLTAHSEIDVEGARRVLRRSMLLNEFGCALAHHAACAKFLEHGAPYGLVFEDDVRLIHSIDTQALQAVLDVSRPVVVSLSQPQAFRADLSLLDGGQEVAGGISRLAVTPVLAAGYALNRSAAALLLRATTPVNCVADWPVRAGGLLSWFGTDQNVVAVPDAVTSNISASSERHVQESWRSLGRRLTSVTHLTYLAHRGDYGSYAAYLMHEVIRGPYFARVSSGRASRIERQLFRAVLSLHALTRSYHLERRLH